jgi:hypothetical protein
MTSRRPTRGHATLLSAAACGLILAGRMAPVAAEETAAHPPAAASGRTARPVDPMALIEGSATAWSVSRTEAGCYLMSPYRKGSSRLAIGRHPSLGIGLFAVEFALAATATDVAEPVVILVGGTERAASGRLIGNKLLFVPLAPAELAAGLRELQDTGALWLQVRHTWLGHGGQTVGEAVSTFGKTCADVAGPSG